MPVKVVPNNQTTSTEDGTIRKAHLEKVKLDFINDVGVSSPTREINKRSSFLISRAQLMALFKKNEVADLLLVHIGVQIPNTIDICEQDESNALSVVFELAFRNPETKEIKAINKIGDFVLINGYQDNEIEKFADACCPSSDPPQEN